jgi:hypothetical protein
MEHANGVVPAWWLLVEAAGPEASKAGARLLAAVRAPA